MSEDTQRIERLIAQITELQKRGTMDRQLYEDLSDELHALQLDAVLAELEDEEAQRAGT
jgi:stress-induced morphogen